MKLVPIVTLLTDFGLSDPYVGIMKGVMLGINPDIRIIDISHSIAPYDIEQAAFMLACTHPYFHRRTVHLVIIDPGVGSVRRPIMVSTDNGYYVAPDNGVLSYIYDRYPEHCVYEITSTHYHIPKRVETFHGRDIFAPSAAWLTRLSDPTQFGDRISDYHRIALPELGITESTISGRIVHIDRFGNAITNISLELFGEWIGELSGSSITIRVGDVRINGLSHYYAEREVGKALALFGGTGHLEVSVRDGSAFHELRIEPGHAVDLSKEV